MKNKRLLVPATLIAIACIAAACGSNNNGNNASSAPSSGAASKPPSGEKVTLTISRWAGPHADDQKEMLKQFEQETGIAVKMDDVDYGQLQQKQTLNMSAKTGGYDLVWAQEIWIPQYIRSGFLLPIDDFVKDDGLNSAYFDFADYNPNLIKLLTSEGKLYGLPTFIQLPIMVYNKDLLQQEGVTPPKTWQETLDVAKRFHDKGTGIALPAKQGQAAVDVFASLMRSNDGNYFGADGKLDVGAQANVEAARFWKDLAAVSMNGSTSWHFDEVVKAVQSGQAPIGIIVSGQAGQLEDQNNSAAAGKLGYSPLPYSKRAYGTLSVWNWCVTADSKHPKEAYRLAAWLTGKATEKAMSLKNGQVAARQSLFNDAELVARFPFFPAIGDSLANADTEPLNPDAPKLMDKMAAALSAIAVGNSDPQAVLDSVQSDLAGTFNK